MNDEVVHGIATRDMALNEGDIIGVDAGLVYEGMYTDMAVTVPVGKVTDEVAKLIKVAKESLEEGLKQIRDGATTGDMGWFIQKYVERHKFGVIRDLVGHGVGRSVHEPPMVPNFGQLGTGTRLQAGMTIAVEPMITIGDYHTKTLDDGWTISTLDGSLAAHFEHTVLVTSSGHEILTK